MENKKKSASAHGFSKSFGPEPPNFFIPGLTMNYINMVSKLYTGRNRYGIRGQSEKTRTPKNEFH